MQRKKRLYANNGGSGDLGLSFSAPLRASLSATLARGSPTPTFTRATTAYVWGYAADADITTDSPILLAVASGEARFVGARRMSEGVWSAVDANGVPLTTTAGASALYGDATGPFGYLAEGARTNRCLQSSEFDEAVWVSGGGGVAVDDQTVAAPDGTTTADTLTASGANGTLIQDLGVVASAAKTFSIWLKRKTGTGDVDLTMDGGSTWTTVAVDADWTRFTKTQTLADEDVGIRLVTSGDAVYAWGAQVETASFASTYIPTTTIAVARNHDVLTYPLAGNAVANGVAESWYAEVQQNPLNTASATVVDTNTTYRALLVEAGGAQRIYAYHDSAPSGPAYSSTGISAGVVSKAAMVYGGGTLTVYRAGAGGTPVSTGAVGANPTTIYVGSDRNGVGATTLFGTIRNLRIYNRALSDAALIAMTT